MDHPEGIACPIPPVGPVIWLLTGGDGSFPDYKKNWQTCNKNHVIAWSYFLYNYSWKKNWGEIFGFSTVQYRPKEVFFRV